MTAQLPSRERLEKIASWREKYGAGNNVMLPAEEAEAMARALLAAHEQEPVAVVELSDFVTAAQLSGDEPRKKSVKELYEGALVVGQNLYTRPAPVPAVPKTMPDDVYDILSKACGDNACLFADELWNACRTAIKSTAEGVRCPAN